MPYVLRHKELGFIEFGFGDVITVTHQLSRRIDILVNGYTRRLRGVRIWGIW